MNFGTVQTRLLLNAGNLPSSHPMHQFAPNYANDGLRFMLLRATQKYANYQLFPEHKDVEWLDSTLAGQNWILLPSDQLAIQRCFSADDPVNPAVTTTPWQWRVVPYLPPYEFDQLPKPATQIAFPSNFTIRENRTYFWPTPQTGKTTRIKIDGIEDTPDLINPSDTPITNLRWHPAWLDCATYLLLTDLRRFDDAKAFLTAADDKIEAIGASMMGLRLAKFHRPLRIMGMPKGNY